VTVAAAGAATYLGIITLEKADEYDNTYLWTPDERAEGDRLALVTDIVIGTAALLGGLTLVLGLVADWGNDPGPRVDVAAVPGGAWAGIGGQL
jgi:hypothetical protein